jgi:hypothetical protein
MKLFLFAFVEKKNSLLETYGHNPATDKPRSITKYSGLELATRKRYNQSLMHVHLHIHAQVSYVCHTYTVITVSSWFKPASFL